MTPNVQNTRTIDSPSVASLPFDAKRAALNPYMAGVHARHDAVQHHTLPWVLATGEDGSGSVAVGKGKGASRLACAETVQQLCELGRAWWDLKKQEQAEREQQQQALKGPVPSRPATTRSR